MVCLCICLTVWERHLKCKLGQWPNEYCSGQDMYLYTTHPLVGLAM